MPNPNVVAYRPLLVERRSGVAPPMLNYATNRNWITEDTRESYLITNFKYFRRHNKMQIKWNVFRADGYIIQLFNYLHFSYFNYLKTLSVSLNGWTVAIEHWMRSIWWILLFQLWCHGIKSNGVEHTSPGAHTYTQQPSTACWTQYTSNNNN